MKTYRRCRICGKEWNVSCLDPGGKVYVCPTCEYKERLKGGLHGARVDGQK